MKGQSKSEINNISSIINENNRNISIYEAALEIARIERLNKEIKKFVAILK